MVKGLSGQMRPGQSGRIAISWKQTELDELEAAPLAFLVVGAAWSWRGQAVLLSDGAEQAVERAGSVGAVSSRTSDRFAIVREISGEVFGSVVLTNGAQRFSADLVVQDGEIDPTFVFSDGCPPRDQSFWICDVSDFGGQAFIEPPQDATVVTFPLHAVTRKT